MSVSSADLEAIIRYHQQHDKSIPEELNPPAIPGGFESWLDAFWELGTDRSVSNGYVGPIPWASIQAYGEFLNLSADELILFKSVMRKMDSAFLKNIRKEEPTSSSETFTRDMLKSAGRGAYHG